MFATRRHILALGGGGLISRALAASLPDVSGRTAFDVDRLLSVGRITEDRNKADCRRENRRYVASATVTLLSIPLVSKNAVGSGYAVAEEIDGPAGHTLSLQFGAGSWPENARGLNRLGFIQEAVIEESPGNPSECAWLAFMTTSEEKDLDQVRKAIETSNAMVPYSASQGCGRNGVFASRVDRLEFASQYTWRDIRSLVERARAAMTMGALEEHQPAQPGKEKTATFLYEVRRAMLDPRSRTMGWLVFNKKQFQLDTQKERDANATAWFCGKELVPASGSVIRMHATLTEKRTGEKTPFRLWYEAGAGQTLPLRFEYQAKPFLRLTFEADTTQIKENA